MKTINIRHAVFETNSSSTHSICISKDNEDLLIPEQISLGLGEFGWEESTLQTQQDRLSYLYTGLHINNRGEDIAKLISILEAKGISIIREEADPDYGYIDHGGEVSEFLDAVMEDENKLLRFLFSPYSVIFTGNDNEGEPLPATPAYCESYFKGN